MAPPVAPPPRRPATRLALIAISLSSAHSLQLRPACACRRPPAASRASVRLAGFSVATGGDDLWSGYVTQDELRDVVEEAMATTVQAPIVPQFYPYRWWLWSQWHGTILRKVLPREVLWNVMLVLVVWLAISFIPQPTQIVKTRFGKAMAIQAASPLAQSLMKSLASVDKVWMLASGLISFTLSFFLSQSYALWRTVYSVTRRVQGRLNDIGLLCATAAERNPDGTYTEDAEDFLSTLARYIRLFNMLFYASVTKRFAPLRTPKGLAELVQQGALTSNERQALLQSSMGHNAVLGWLSTLFNSALSDGRMASNPTGGSTLSLQIALQNKVVELRSTYASIEDELTGRMPLAYTQLVQIMVDLLIFCTPFALMHSVGGVGAMVGTGLITLFHSSILNLAKMFLDPFNNDDYGDGAGISVNVATLLQETNIGSERWRRSASWVPEAARPIVRRAPLPRDEMSLATGEIIDEAEEGGGLDEGGAEVGQAAEGEAGESPSPQGVVAVPVTVT
ncbi:hypothetical protein AB1Y20_018581 [Prymnesium parvum]|uniref:ABC transmembrane type-1 domain-containing protein n=1 Tax=Prymnesium parvum TaxID=97485 RepID=A0AB34JQA5_PRYPA